MAKGNLQLCQDKHPNRLHSWVRKSWARNSSSVYGEKESLEKTLKHIDCGLQGYDCIREDVKETV